MTRFIALFGTLVLAALGCGAALAYVPPKGVAVELVEFKSAGRTVQGAAFSPDPKVFRDPTVGVILVHGVESHWYSGPPMFLGINLAERGYATLAYDGAHAGESFRTSDFDTAVKEVGDAIAFLKSRGINRIFLIGHSLGTPIVEYFQGVTPDPAVVAVALYGPHIDIPAVTRDALLGPALYEKFLAQSRDLVAKGKGDEIQLMPYRNGRVIITSAKTFVSYRDVETSHAAVESAVRHIRVPMLVVYDPADNIQGMGVLIKRETIAHQIADGATATKADIAVIPSVEGNSPLQAHSFVHNEKIVTERTIEWLKGIGLPPAPPR